MVEEEVGRKSERDRGGTGGRVSGINLYHAFKSGI